MDLFPFQIHVERLASMVQFPYGSWLERRVHDMTQ
jgi:hypothetical protein